MKFLLLLVSVKPLITVLSEKGIPTALAATMLRAPMSRMDILTADEINSINRASGLVSKYSQTIDRESAYEILSRKIEAIEKDKAGDAAQKEWEKRQREMARGRESGRARQGAKRRSSAPAEKDNLYKKPENRS